MVRLVRLAQAVYLALVEFLESLVHRGYWGSLEYLEFQGQMAQLVFKALQEFQGLGQLHKQLFQVQHIPRLHRMLAS
jgi:hypothetical protein